MNIDEYENDDVVDDRSIYVEHVMAIEEYDRESPAERPKLEMEVQYLAIAIHKVAMCHRGDWMCGMLKALADRGHGCVVDDLEGSLEGNDYATRKSALIRLIGNRIADLYEEHDYYSIEKQFTYTRVDV